MPLTVQQKHTIELCYREKGWCGAKIAREFPSLKGKRSAINRVIVRIKKTGSAGRKKGSGRPRTARTAANEDKVEELVCSQDGEPGTHRSQRQISRKLKMSRSSVQRIVKAKRMRAFKRLITPMMTLNVRRKRAIRAQRLYKTFPESDIRRIVFTDEKDFTLDVPLNRQNDRVYGRGRKSEVSPERLLHQKSRFSKKVMVSAGVSWNGKTDIFFLDTDVCKVDSTRYIRLLDDELLPGCRHLHPDNNFIFLQDGAPSHRSRQTQQYLAENTPQFISKDDWPPNSPDLNPLDYSVWNALSEKVYDRQVKFGSPAELRETIKEKWEEVSVELIRGSIRQWKSRLLAVVRAEGGPIVHAWK